MNKSNVIVVGLCIVSIVLAIVSFSMLPSSVIIQFSMNEAGTTTAPKLIAILLPFTLSIGGALSVFLTKDEGAGKKGILVSAIGILLFVVMLVVNCMMKA